MSSRDTMFIEIIKRQIYPFKDLFRFEILDVDLIGR